MDKFKNFIAKVTATWSAIGAAIITFGATGFIQIPELIKQLFSAEVITSLDVMLQAIVVAIGAVISFYQVVRVIFASNKSENEIKVLTTKGKVAYLVNPFKIAA